MRAQAQEYGEDEKALGQFVDDFENLDNVSVIVDVVRNATYNAMELFYNESVATSTVVFSPIQLREHDYHPSYNPVMLFNKYASMIQVLSSPASSLGQGNIFFIVDREWIDGKYMRWKWDINYGTSVTWLLDGEYTRSSMVDFPSNSAMMLKGNGVLQVIDTTVGLKVSDVLIDASGGVEDKATILIRLQDSWTSTIVYLDLYWLQINEGGGGFGNIIDWNMNVGGTILTMEQTGTLNDYGRVHEGNIQDYEVTGEGYTSSGYFTTVDYLSDPFANGSVLVQMTNATIPANTAITVQFSDDNSTWVDNEGAAGSNALTDGFLSIDLRELNWSAAYHLRYNFSTTDPAETPRLYQSRLITTIGNASIITEHQNITGEWIEYNLTSIIVNVGTHDSGNLASTFFVDGDTYDISETVGTPAWIISFNWTNVDQDANSLWVLIYSFYDGNLVHDIDLQLYNFTSTTWTDIAHIPDMVGFEWINASIYDLRIPNDFIDSTGAVLGRIIHVPAGNMNHDMLIDQIQLQAFIPTGAAAAEETFQLFWIAIAIALMIIGIVLARMWPDEGDP